MNIDADIALIGAGPLGLEMAVGLKRAAIPCVHLEARQIGATMEWWAPGTRWFSSNERISIAGVPLETPQQEKATREEYLAYLRSVVGQFNLNIETYTRVTHIEKHADHFLLRARRSVANILTGDECLYRVKKVILTTGGTERPNLLNVPGENLPHVSHYFRDPHAYFHRKLLIVGGRNSAVEAALRCHRAGARVTLSYRREAVDAKDIKYWLYPEFSALVKAEKIRAHIPSQVLEITPTTVRLKTPAGEKTLPADFVLLLTGYLADLSLAQMAGVELTGDQQLPAFNPETMETNIPGIYVAGTAIAGTQCRYKIFLENCHAHVERIIGHLTGHIVHGGEECTFERPET